MKLSIKLVVLLTVFWLSQGYSEPEKLIIWVEPSDVPVKMSIAKISSISESLLQIDSYADNRTKYTYKISADTDDGVFLKYYLSALDSNTQKKIVDLDIWIPIIVENKEVLVVLKKPHASEEAVLGFSRRGLRGANAYRTYFESKTIYQEIEQQSPNHYLGGLAAYWWFSSAYELAKRDGSVVPMDTKAVEAAKSILSRSQNNSKYKSAMSAWKIDVDVLEIEIDRAKRVKWQGYSLVKKAKNKKNYIAALNLVEYYESMYNTLPLVEKKKISKEYGVYSKRINDDKAYFQTLVGQ